MDFTSCANTHQRGKYIIALRSLELWTFTTLPLTLTTKPLQELGLHTSILSGGAELAAGEGGPELANKWPEDVIGLTRD
jgi:hypothetical protein